MKALSPNWILLAGLFLLLSTVSPAQTTARTPRVDFATYLGGSSDTFVAGVAVDKSGYIYVTGGTEASDFPTTAGAYRRSLLTCPDTSESCSRFTTFVAKLTRDGRDLVYSTFIEEKDPVGIAIDKSGNVYLAGDQAYVGTAGSWITKCADSYIGCNWVVKLNSTGSAKVFSTLLEPGAVDPSLRLKALAINAQRAVYIVGEAHNGRYTTSTAYKRTISGDSAPFVMKIAPDGASLLYATYVTGAVSNESANAIVVDDQDHAIITGATYSSLFPTTSNAFQRGGRGPADAYIARLSSDGSKLLTSTLFGGSAYEEGYGVATDSSHNVYIAGSTWSTDYPATQGAFDRSYSNTTCNGFPCGDVFVAKLSSDFSTRRYSTLLGGTGSDYPHALVVDSVGHAYVSGTTTSTDFPLSKATRSTPSAFFLTKLNTGGTALAFSTYYGGSIRQDYRNSNLAVDIGGNAYVAGTSSASNFPTTSNAFQHAKLNTGITGYLAKYDIPPCTLSSTTPSLTVCAPASGSSVNTPFIVSAGATDDHSITSMAVYIDGIKRFSISKFSHFDTRISASPGTRKITVKAWDTAGRVLSSTRYVTVY
jgi:hypothetical protein